MDRCNVFVFMMALLCFGYAGTGLRYLEAYDELMDATYTPAVSIVGLLITIVNRVKP